jgi:hypothetical protein
MSGAEKEMSRPFAELVNVNRDANFAAQYRCAIVSYKPHLDAGLCPLCCLCVGSPESCLDYIIFKRNVERAWLRAVTE